jgi:hypothetical protein
VARLSLDVGWKALAGYWDFGNTFPVGVMRTSAIVLTVMSLIAASGVALSAMIHGAGKFEWNGFYPWVIGPYIVLLVVFGFPRGQTDARAFAGCVAAVAVLVFTCWFYIGAMWLSSSSTSALIFIFGPAYLFVGGLIVWGIAWFLFARLRLLQRAKTGTSGSIESTGPGE